MLSDSAGLVERLGLAQLDTPQLHHILVAARAQAEHLRAATSPEAGAVLRRVLQRVEIGTDVVAIHLDHAKLLDWVAGLTDAIQSDGSALTFTVPVRLKRRGVELKLVLADRQQPIRRDRSLITALARGFGWYEELCTGASASLGAIADRENVSPTLIRRCIDLALLPTDLVEAIVAGQQPIELTSETFKQIYPLAVRWREQRQDLGLGSQTANS
jgi:site-specific DNA recombinase